MAEPICTAIIPEKAVLIGLITSKQDENSVREYLDELSFLVDTAGAIPVHRFLQRLEMPDSRTYVGSGKLAEIKFFIKDSSI